MSDNLELVHFMTTELGDDLIVSFFVAKSQDPSDGRSIILMRDMKWAHLQALGAPEPDMPPFDESKYDPIPEVEINPKDEFWVDPSEPLEALLDLP